MEIEIPQIQSVRELLAELVWAHADRSPEAEIEILNALEAAQPYDGRWPERAAEVYRDLGDPRAEVAALMRASDTYESVGSPLKAAALYRRVLELKPEHTGAREALAELQWCQIAPPEPLQAPSALAGTRSGSEPSTDLGDDEYLEEITLSRDDMIEGDAPEEFDAESGARQITFSRVRPPGAAPNVDDVGMGILGHSPLLSSLPSRAVERLVLEAELVSAPEGGQIFSAGDRDEALYVIIEGAVVILAEEPKRSLVAALAEGQFFGEAALLCASPRSATARAVVDTSLLRIPRPLLGSLVREFPETLAVLLEALSERMARRLICTSPLFSGLARAEQLRLCARMRFLEAVPGTVLIRQGEPPRALFLVLSGRLQVVRSVNEVELSLADLGPGDVLGELALLAHEHNRASVRATTKVWLLYLSAAEARALLENDRIRPRILEIAQLRKRQNEARIAQADCGAKLGASDEDGKRRPAIAPRSLSDEVLRDLLIDRTLAIG